MAKKWNSDSTPTEKVLVLFGLLLFNRRSYSLTELSSEYCLNASKATVLRLLRQLSSSRLIPLQVEKRGRENYYCLKRQKVLPGFALDADGLFQLAMCRDFIANLLPTAVREQTLACISRVAELLPPEQGALPPAIAGSLGKGTIDYSPFQSVFETLARAISIRRVCRVQYRSAAGGKPRTFDFAPLRLQAYHDCLYVDGWDLTDDDPPELRHDDQLRLALQRFGGCELTEKSASHLPPLPKNNGAMGIMPARPEDEFEIRVHFDRRVASYVAERQWSQEQKIEFNPDDGSVTLTARMANASEAMAWLLGFGDAATLLSPTWLARDLAQTLERMLEKYRGAADKNIGSCSTRA